MSDIKLGNIIIGDANKDAIHVALAPVVAEVSLSPGEHVRLTTDGKATNDDDEPYIGIVDPFLKNRVRKGEKFWLLLYQQTVTGMRHEWTHPAFNDKVVEVKKSSPKTQKEISEAWIRNYADELGLHYNSLIQGAANYLDYDDYLVQGGLLEGQTTSEEFWAHYKNITGREGSGSFFSCSC